ncbi:XdhC family protein [Paenibacillus sp. GCM10023252]|uniref:XdhC family protein n=1 Tax=Paenibacillus sp. GCM10023252 TaxID=3252649 RepID=UPI00361A3C95
MNSLHSLLKLLNSGSSARYVLATLIGAEGHAYRKAGAVMLLGENGWSAGQLSPGCVESDLHGQAESVRNSGITTLVEYDMRTEDDLSWGEAVGCGGRLQVLLEPVQGNLRRVLRAMEEALDLGGSLKLQRSCSQDGTVSEYRLMTEGGQYARFGRGSEQCPDYRLTLIYEPNPRLIVIGAGQDAQPVVQLAACSGFSVIVVDRREGLLTARDFPLAERLLTGSVDEVIPALGLRSDDRVLIMSHQMRQDLEWLGRMEEGPPRYIGLLGSKRRCGSLLEKVPRLLRDARVHAPVGLGIGAEGAYQIAVSIVGELITDVRLAREERQLLREPLRIIPDRKRSSMYRHDGLSGLHLLAQGV